MVIMFVHAALGVSGPLSFEFGYAPTTLAW